MSQLGLYSGAPLSLHDHSTSAQGGQLQDSAFSAPPGRGWEYLKHSGVTNFESWYSMPVRNNSFSTIALANGVQYAIPFPILKTQATDLIAISITAAVAGGARLGIYADSGNLYPGTLIIDAGAVTTAATGVRSEACVQTLTEGTLYWLSVIAGAAFTIEGVASADSFPILGYPNTLTGTQNPSLSVAQAYGALPGTFPAGAAILAGVIPAVFVRFSS